MREGPCCAPVHHPRDGTGRPHMSSEAESLTALRGTAAPCQGPRHRSDRRRVQSSDPASDPPAPHVVLPPQPHGNLPHPLGSGKRNLRPRHQELGGPGAKGRSPSMEKCCRTRLLVGTPWPKETPVTGCGRVMGPPRRPAGTPRHAAREHRLVERTHGRIPDSVPRPQGPGAQGVPPARPPWGR